MKITSVNNDLIKEVAKLQQRKYRDEKKQFLLEGNKCIDEAIQYQLEIENIFVLENSGLYKEHNSIEVSESVLKKISSTSSAPKAVAVAKILQKNWSNNYNNVILLEDIKDAGNLGTILRTACAFDVDAIILYGDTVDLYNPKCVRASVGNLWKIPVFEISEFEDLKKKFVDYERIATLPKSENTLWLKDFLQKGKTLVMFGTESMMHLWSKKMLLGLQILDVMKM